MFRSPPPLARLACFIACLWVLDGCATLAGRKQYLSIDSTPRGLEVLDPEDPHQVLGRTPLFVQLPRDTSHDFRLRAPSGAEWTTPMDCRFRYRGALLGNIPAALLGSGFGPVGMGLAYAAGNGIDLATGAAWECPWRFRVSAEWAQKPDAPPPPEACPVSVVLPPEVPDEKLSNLAVAKWKERFARENGCGKLADEEAAASYFRRYNVTHDASIVPPDVDPPRLNELGFKTGATHAVVLVVKDGGRWLKVEPTRYDLHSLRAETEQSFDIDLDREGVQRAGLLAMAARYLRFLPNSVAFSAAQKEFQFQGANGGRVLSDAAPPSILPSVLSNWTVTWIEHPDQHGAWDATFGLSPTLVLGYNARDLTVADEGGEAARALSVSLVHGVVLYGANVGFHTPIGAFGLGLGVGGGFAWAWEDGAFLGWTWRAYADARVDYTAFLTENLFLQLAVETYASGPPNASGDRWQLSMVRQQSITLGYYLPQLRSFVRNLF